VIFLDKIRAFIAVPAPDEVKRLIDRIENELRSAGADVKWVEPDNVHVTLKFLGNITPDRVEIVGEEITQALTGVRRFEVEVSGMGTFPKHGRSPRVIWLGLGQGSDMLCEVARRVEDVCANLGFEKEERPFQPHLTIGRVRRGSPNLGKLRDEIDRIEYNPLKLLVDRVNLMRSELSPRGPTYTVLVSMALEET